MFRRAPIPFKAALQDHSRAIAPEVEAGSKVDAEPWPEVPVAPDKQLMDLRLGARWNINALDLSVIL